MTTNETKLYVNDLSEVGQLAARAILRLEAAIAYGPGSTTAAALRFFLGALAGLVAYCTQEQIHHTKECATCKGEGWMMNEDGQPCPVCTPKDGSTIGGTGRVPDAQD